MRKLLVLAALWPVSAWGQQALTVPCWLEQGGIRYDQAGLPPIPRTDEWSFLAIDLPAVRGTCILQQTRRAAAPKPAQDPVRVRAEEATRMAEQAERDRLYRRDMDRRACREAVDRVWANSRPWGSTDSCAQSFACTDREVHKYDVCP
jgi:hypothetical protein